MKRIIVLILFLVIVPILTGCWDNRDINKINVVTAIAIDKTENGEIEVTLQIVKPEILKAIQQGSSEEVFWNVSGTGNTTFEALRNTLTTTSNKNFFTFVKLIVIGEEIAHDGILGILDFFERDHETKKRANLIIARGIKAKEVLTAKSEFNYLTSEHYVGIIENTKSLPKIIKIRLIDILREVTSKGNNSVIGVIKRNEDQPNEGGASENELMVKDFEIVDGAVFKGDKLIGWLNEEETTGYLYVINEVKNHVLNIKKPNEEDKKVAIELNDILTKIDVRIENNIPVLMVDVKVKGLIADQQGSGDLTTSEKIPVIEQSVAAEIRKLINDVFFTTQNQFKDDIFGFGEIVHRKELKYWKTVEDNWHEKFSQSLVEIKIEVTIKRSGLTKKAPEVNY